MTVRTPVALPPMNSGARRQRQEARREAEDRRVADANFIQQLQRAANEDTQLSTITVAPAKPTTPAPSSPPFASISLISTLPIRSPVTPRPRLRRTPSPEALPLTASTYEPPSSTAPPNLGREKRKRAHTRKYQESRANGNIQESQEEHKAGRQG